MTYDEAKIVRGTLEDVVKATSKVVRAFPKGPTGLTPGHVKSSPEFKAAKAAYNRVFSDLRDFNAFFVEEFSKEIRADRRR